MNISFHNEDIRFRLRHIKLSRVWINQIAAQFGKDIEQLSFVFCSDEYLLQINRSYLGHDYYTDIITFPYQDQPIVSDIFISLDRVKENSKAYDVTHEKELRRVIAHGILHLCGLNDKSENERKEMRAQEESALILWEDNYLNK